MEAGWIGFACGLAGVGVSLAISKLLNYLATNGSLNGENGNFLSGLMGGIGPWQWVPSFPSFQDG